MLAIALLPALLALGLFVSTLLLAPSAPARGTPRRA